MSSTDPFAPKAAVPEASTDYASLTAEELRGLLEERGLATTGKKAELVDRLIEDDGE
ncbi:MAG TPA: SAP domain-containing protein [Tepidiformaceae bacterium]|jgi:hypothetical protein|nr:SAP domain-containing protein [Tepidiformaceae bacterium]